MKFTQQSFLNLKGDPAVLIKQWQDSQSEESPHTFMGLTPEELGAWLVDHHIFDLVAFLRGQVSEFSIEWDNSLAIAPYPVWVCWYECYMHVAGSVSSLSQQVHAEFRNEMYMIG